MNWASSINRNVDLRRYLTLTCASQIYHNFLSKRIGLVCNNFGKFKLMNSEINLVFLDTEFTCFSNPELISIGLASSSGKEFYAEAQYDVSSCSDFVRRTVIPLLSHARRISNFQIHAEILNWLTSLRTKYPTVICCDSDYDRILFLRLFAKNLPEFLIIRTISCRHFDGNKKTEFYLENQLNEHHALNDAMALRHSFRGWVRSIR